VPIVDRAPDDLAVLIFTSGTAGSPKAAMLSHGNLLANIEQTIALRGEGDATDVGFGVLPMFHIFGLNVVLGTALHAGASVLLVERFDPIVGVGGHPEAPRHGAARRAVRCGRPGRPCRTSPEDSFATIKVATSGAAHLDPLTWPRAVKARFGARDRRGLRPHRGLSGGHRRPSGCRGDPGRSGAAVDGVDIRLVDVDGEDALVGDPGEIWVRGPNVFQGYWNDAEATRQRHRRRRAGSTPATSPWSTTRACLYLVDRAKDLIIVSGFNVFPAEVEEVVLRDARGPAECAIVGVPHPHTGEAVKAFVVVEPGPYALEEDAVIEYCAAHLARYKCPQKVNFVDELPLNLSGKVLRARCCAAPCAEPGGRGPTTSATADPSAPDLSARLCDLVHERRVAFARPHARSSPTTSPRPPWPGSRSTCGAWRSWSTRRRHRLLGAPGRDGRRQRRQGAQGPLLPRLLRHPGRGLRRRVPAFQMSRELGLTHDWPVVIVGAGNLGPGPGQLRRVPPARLPGGRAARRQPGQGGRQYIHGVPVHHIDDLPELARRARASPSASSPPPPPPPRRWPTQLAAAGVRSILNFAPTVITVPEGTSLRKVDLALELQVLSFYQQHAPAEPGGVPPGLSPGGRHGRRPHAPDAALPGAGRPRRCPLPGGGGRPGGPSVG
jgi:NADH/NAD ratio-sensing transcriptional regulator Rex